jgi:hypothetical protein
MLAYQAMRKRHAHQMSALGNFRKQGRAPLTSIADHQRQVRKVPTSRLVHRSNQHRYSITSPALSGIDVGMVRRKARAVTKLATSLKRVGRSRAIAQFFRCNVGGHTTIAEFQQPHTSEARPAVYREACCCRAPKCVCGPSQKINRRQLPNITGKEANTLKATGVDAAGVQLPTFGSAPYSAGTASGVSGCEAGSVLAPYFSIARKPAAITA